MHTYYDVFMPRLVLLDGMHQITVMITTCICPMQFMFDILNVTLFMKLSRQAGNLSRQASVLPH